VRDVSRIVGNKDVFKTRRVVILKQQLLFSLIQFYPQVSVQQQVLLYPWFNLFVPA
jgi:dolichyl-phosphate-mannose--protein O-mannosyl transferase